MTIKCALDVISKGFECDARFFIVAARIAGGNLTFLLDQAAQIGFPYADVADLRIIFV